MSTQKGISGIKKSLVILLANTMTFVLLLLSVSPAAAQVSGVAPGRKVSPAPTQPQGPTDRVELESFLDGYFVKTMEDYHIAGAAIAVVKDGKLFFTKGYGYADVEKGISVDPEETIFHIGSVGKLFTWTAVMQLVEQGKLDLGGISIPTSTFTSRILIPKRSPSSNKLQGQQDAKWSEWFYDMAIT
jgi:hypothetical protein